MPPKKKRGGKGRGGGGGRRGGGRGGGGRRGGRGGGGGGRDEESKQNTPEVTQQLLGRLYNSGVEDIKTLRFVTDVQGLDFIADRDALGNSCLDLAITKFKHKFLAHILKRIAADDRVLDLGVKHPRLGVPPLFLAISKGNSDAVSALLAAGAETTMTKRDGKEMTAVTAALLRKDQAIAQLLHDHEAKGAAAATASGGAGGAAAATSRKVVPNTVAQMRAIGMLPPRGKDKPRIERDFPDPRLTVLSDMESFAFMSDDLLEVIVAYLGADACATPPVWHVLRDERTKEKESLSLSDAKSQSLRITAQSTMDVPGTCLSCQAEGKSDVCDHEERRGVDPNMWHFSHLLELTLSVHDMSVLPTDFIRLRGLVDLDLSNNSLEQLPDVFDKFTNLKTFVCANNKLRTLPGTLAALTALEKLDVNANHIASIAVVSDMKNLYVLNISHNALKALDADFEGMEHLRECHAAGNEAVEELPVALVELPQLLVLDASDCGLLDLPSELGSAKKLTTLKVQNNPYNDPKLKKQAKQAEAGGKPIKTFLKFLAKKK